MHTPEVSSAQPQILARAVAILTLLMVGGGIFAQGLVSDRLISYSDAALTARNILANRALFQTSFTVYLLEMACQIAFTAVYYLLLRPAGRNIALVATFIDLSASIIKTTSRLFYIVPLFVLSGTPTLSAFTPQQLREIALLLLRINDRGAAMSLGLFGISGVLTAYLIIRSTFLPRWLGILSMIGAAGWLRFLFPALRFPPFSVIAVIALLVLAVKCVWLIVVGVDEKKWVEENLMSAH